MQTSIVGRAQRGAAGAEHRPADQRVDEDEKIEVKCSTGSGFHIGTKTGYVSAGRNR